MGNPVTPRCDYMVTVGTLERDNSERHLTERARRGDRQAFGSVVRAASTNARCGLQPSPSPLRLNRPACPRSGVADSGRSVLGRCR